MKQFIIALVAMPAVALAGPASAATVIVDEDSVTTVQQTRPVVVVEPSGAKTVAVVKDAVVRADPRDPRMLEGEVVRVDHPSYTLTVRDVDGRDRRVLLRRGTINNYKVDDYVVIRLTRDLQEALSVKTRHTADIEGDIVQLDRSAGTLVIREKNGSDKTVAAREDVLGGYKVGDRVRLYIVSDNPDFREAKMIRVR